MNMKTVRMVSDEKTEEEIAKLKESWLKDPCWEIEDTEEFEEHREELLAFHEEQESLWKAERLERQIQRGEKVGAWTGIYDIDLAQYLFTPDEIENEIRQGETHQDLVVVQAAHARATLLMAAQIKRVAEALEARNKTDESDSNLESMVRLYKVD